jgi:Rps23 Pro-64 3,4-dihydroxylase Tpa1-like proline 4-hydroxylase
MIKVYDFLFPDELIIEGNYYFNNYDQWDYLADSPQYDNATLGKTFVGEFEPIAYKFIEYLDRSDFRKCLYNCFSYGDSPRTHIDSHTEKGVTYLIYLNSFWDVNMGGETVFVSDDGEIIQSVTPKPGRLIKFQSNILHLGRPPVRQANTNRYSLVFQTHPVDYTTIGDLLQV